MPPPPLLPASPMLSSELTSSYHRPFGQSTMLQETARAATSKSAQRAVVNTVLLICTGVLLFVLAVLSTALFYREYMPDLVATAPVHLQYG